jgi:DNA-directed RNA polymerase specialized sigma24 family protein
MYNYLQGARNKLRAYVRKRKRKEPGPELLSEVPADGSSLKDENERLRQQVQRMQEELRAARATFEAELQEAEKRHRAELKKAFHAYGPPQRDEVVKVELEALREKLLERHGKGIKILQDRHGRNKRRLWRNFLKK